ncbi:MAG: carboxypeptidase regulatory-like domain-containing protein [Gemmatimonadetes bacterium]|nr:carboxypeptidase regulatory-like domain-containing protein [Gemmatimonadota bacterium]
MQPRAVHRLAVTAAVALLLLGLFRAGAEAQATNGKIQGRVTNAQSGEPIAAAQVTVEGTTLGNITNDDGFYFINEVPPGLHSIRAQSIGFRAVVVADQRVLAGQTTTLNFQLESAAVQLDPLIVSGERNPLVPRDQVSSKAIVTGEKIDQLPLDNSSSIILLQPGVISTNSGRSIRGSRPGEEAVYVDGVPIRRLRTGATEPVEIPTNVLAQVDVTTGGISARFADAQSGVINYVTRSGGPTFGGTASFFTDMLGPKDWSEGFSRGELSLGGPVSFVNNLTFFVGGTAEGRKYAGLHQGLVSQPGFFYASGVDTVFRLPRTSSVSGMTDSVDVVVPNFTTWDNGNRAPTGVSDEYNLTAKLAYGLPRGGKVDLTYYRTRDQSIGRGLGSLYNADAWNGSYASEDVLTLGTYFLLSQTSERQIALDLKASYQRDWTQSGDIAPEDRFSKTNPFLGFNFSNLNFLMDPDDWPVTETLVKVARSGVLPADSLQILPRRSDLGAIQGASGVRDPLRLNPYGMRSGWSTSGIGNTGQSYTREARWYFSGTADWQMNRYNRFWVGGDITMADTEVQNVPLFDGRAIPVMYSPTRAGIYAQNRLDIGDVVLEGGLRWEYFDPDGDFPTIPGYVFNVPDSLTQDFVRIRQGEGPLLDRVEENSDCGGDLTAPERRRSDGTLVCKPNFVKAESRTTLSPRLAVSFPVTATSTFRFSYSHNTQVPPLTVLGGLFSANYNDLQGGLANTNTQYGRDVDIPRTVLFEAGYRQVFGGATVIDVAAYSKTTRNSLTYRKLPFPDPNEGNTIFLNVLTNADYSLARGLDFRLDRRFSEIADLSINYSYVDARGTGSEPNTYTNLILRRNTNLSILTGNPVDPPELLLTLNQSRAHNVAGTFSLLFPADYKEGTVAGTILSDAGIFATMRLASGLPYTRLKNAGNGQTGPPTFAGLGGIPDEDLNASRTPGVKMFDLRLTRGFRVGDNRLRAFADLRNPFHIVNTFSVWLETGEVTNAVHRQNDLDALLRDATLDGDANIDGFDIVRESPDNALNRYMLLQAEARFGDGDGIFTVAEQRAAFGAWYDLFNSPLGFRNGDRSLRLGLEFVF